MKLVVLVVTGCLFLVAGGLFALSFRRDKPMLGLTGLAVAVSAGFVALPLSSLPEF